MQGTPQVGTGEITWQAYRWRDEIPVEARDVWHSLFAAMPTAPVYLHPEWMEMAVQCGIVAPWQLLVIRRNTTPVGLLALERRSPWSARLVLRSSPESPPLLMLPGAEEHVWQGLARWLQAGPIAAISLGRCQDASRLEAFRATSALQPTLQSAPPSIVISLTGGWEDYLASLGSSTRASMKRREGRLYRDYPQTRIVQHTSAEASAMLAELFELYRRHWGQQLGGCLFDNPRYAAFYTRAMQWAIDRDYGALFGLYIGDRLVSGQATYGVAGSSMLYCDVTARVLDEEIGKYSPSTVVLNHVIRWALERGVREIDLAYGNTAHKLSMGGEERPCWELQAARSSLAARGALAVERALHVTRRLPVHASYHLRRVFHQVA